MRPRPSDDPVMNTRASPTPPVMPTYRLTIPKSSPCAPRASLHSVLGTTPARCFLMAAINFVRTSSNSGYPGELPLGPYRRISRPDRPQLGTRPQAITRFAYRFSVSVDYVA